MFSKFSRIRVPVTTVVTLLVIFYDFFYRNIEVYQINSSIGYLSVVLIVLGLAIRAWSAGTLVKNEKLTTTGPYALVRNPLYSGTLMMTIGFLLLIGDLFTTVVAVVLILALYIPVIIREEEILTNHYKGRGIEEFYESTSRIFPFKFSRVKDIFEGSWSYEQWKKNGEYNAPLGAIIILVLIHFYGVMS